MTDTDKTWTTISIDKQTRDKIRQRKRGGESYDELLTRELGL